MKTLATAICILIVAAALTGCANRSCRDWPGTCIIQ